MSYSQWPSQFCLVLRPPQCTKTCFLPHLDTWIANLPMSSGESSSLITAKGKKPRYPTNKKADATQKISQKIRRWEDRDAIHKLFGTLNQNLCGQKLFWKRRFTEPCASRESTRSWGAQSEPPAAGRDGKHKHAHCLELTGSFIQWVLGRKM